MVSVLDLPDDGGASAACASVSKGLVMHVDKCLDHDHWIHLHSLDRWEAVADGIYLVIAHDDALIESDTSIRLTTPIIDLCAADFVRGRSPHFIFGLDSPFADARDGCMQLAENENSGIYLGNTKNPAAKVLDWYEEATWEPEWDAGGEPIPAPATATFTRVGNLVAAHVSLAISAALPSGDSAWAFSLPYPPAGDGFCGAAIIVHGGLPRTATTLIAGGRACVLARMPSPGVEADDVYVTTDSPAVLEAGDTLSLSIVYPVAA